METIPTVASPAARVIWSTDEFTMEIQVACPDCGESLPVRSLTEGYFEGHLEEEIDCPLLRELADYLDKS
jgi:hypothetical protein